MCDLQDFQTHNKYVINADIKEMLLHKSAVAIQLIIASLATSLLIPI
jgi:hypothetical protein